ncbi:hypothetical protein ACRAWF_42985 [Streptomyces sp. L7]
MLTFLNRARPLRRDVPPPLYYQQVRGEGVIAAGLLLAPQGLGSLLARDQLTGWPPPGRRVGDAAVRAGYGALRPRASGGRPAPGRPRRPRPGCERRQGWLSRSARTRASTRSVSHTPAPPSASFNSSAARSERPSSRRSWRTVGERPRSARVRLGDGVHRCCSVVGLCLPVRVASAELPS